MSTWSRKRSARRGTASPLRASRRKRHERLRLLLVETVDGRGGHAGQQDRAVAGVAGGEHPVAERHPPGRHVPPGVADGEFGQQQADAFLSEAHRCPV